SAVLEAILTLAVAKTNGNSDCQRRIIASLIMPCGPNFTRLPQGFYLALIMVIFATIVPSLYGQDNPASQQRPRRAMPAGSEPQEVIKIDTDLVPVDVTVTDVKGRLVRNLKKEDFKLFEDGIERPIASFNIEKIEGAPRPLAIV